MTQLSDLGYFVREVAESVKRLWRRRRRWMNNEDGWRQRELKINKIVYIQN